MAYMYTLPERVADGTVHVLAIGASITGTVLLIIYAAKTQSGLDVAAASVYGAFVIFTFVASALYHLTPWHRVRPWLHRIDHAAIYLKIAGTYTPLVVILGTASAYVVLAAVWGVALIGAVGKLTTWIRPGVVSTYLYIAMGWASLLLIWQLVAALPLAALILMFAGGVTYTVGAAFNHWDELRFNIAIWHVFVLTGSTLFFSAIAVSLAAQTAL